MAITLDTITLPDDLLWPDETDWSPVVQTIDHTLTGSLLVETAAKLAGRPITLGGDEGSSWMSRVDVLALMALAAVPGKVMVLDYHGRTFNVVFRHHDPPALDAAAIVPMVPPADADWYSLRLKLMAV